MREISFKELAHAVMRADNSEICRAGSSPEIQGRAGAAALRPIPAGRVSVLLS